MGFYLINQPNLISLLLNTSRAVSPYKELSTNEKNKQKTLSNNSCEEKNRTISRMEILPRRRQRTVCVHMLKNNNFGLCKHEFVIVVNVQFRFRYKHLLLDVSISLDCLNQRDCCLNYDFSSSSSSFPFSSFSSLCLICALSDLSSVVVASIS